MVDALDTLAIMEEWETFENGMELLSKHIFFNSDLTVNVFETNIRGLGCVVCVWCVCVVCVWCVCDCLSVCLSVCICMSVGVWVVCVCV